MRQRKNSAVVEVRCDLQVLAALARYFKTEKPRSKSELVRVSLEVLHDSLLAQGSIEPVPTLGEAIDILSSLGLEGATRKARREVVKILGEETIAEADSTLHEMIKRARREHKG